MEILSSLQKLDVALLELIRHGVLAHAGWLENCIWLVSDSEPILFALFLIVLWLYGWQESKNGPKHVSLDLFWHVM